MCFGACLVAWPESAVSGHDQLGDAILLTTDFLVYLFHVNNALVPHVVQGIFRKQFYVRAK